MLFWCYVVYCACLYRILWLNTVRNMSLLCFLFLGAVWFDLGPDCLPWHTCRVYGVNMSPICCVLIFPIPSQNLTFSMLDKKLTFCNIFLIFPIKYSLALCANCLRKQFKETIQMKHKTISYWKTRKIFQIFAC